MASVFQNSLLSLQQQSFSGAQVLARCEHFSFAHVTPLASRSVSSSLSGSVPLPARQTLQLSGPNGIPSSRLAGAFGLSIVSRENQWEEHELPLPPLASMGDFMVELLRVPGRAPSKFATEAEQAVATLAKTSWGMDPEAFAMYNRIGVWFSSCVFPSTVSVERLSAVCIHQGLFALLDDLCFDTDGLDPTDFGIQQGVVRNSPCVGDFFRDVNAVFRTLQMPAQPTPVDRAIFQAGTELRRLATPEWHQFLADAVEDFVDSCITLQGDLDVDAGGPRLSVTDLESYTHIRCRNSGMLHVCLLMEVACDAMLPTEVRAHPSIQRLTWLCGEIVSFVNDIFSYHKDVVVEGSQFNLIKVLVDTEGMSFAQAVCTAMDLVCCTTKAFADIEAALPLWESPAVDRTVRRYVRGLRECIVGNFHFHARMNRYRSPDSPFPELRTLI